MKGKTILLIDDEVNLQNLIAIALKYHQYDVVVAGNGMEGLKQLKTIKPHLIILDINMPKMGGLEFYSKICDENNNARYPVLVLTACTNMENLPDRLKFNGFMTKPFEIEDLIQEADNIIKKTSSYGS